MNFVEASCRAAAVAIDLALVFGASHGAPITEETVGMAILALAALSLADRVADR